MKSIYERIKNNIRPILQLLLLVGVFFAPRIFKITELIKTPPKLEASQKICDYIFYFAWKGGDWAIGVFFLIVVLFIIRKWNKTYMFNRGNYYKQYRYGWYRICSKILGYSECNLIQVPIYMQFKLVLNDTFDKYNCGEFDKKENDTISVSKSNFSHETDEVNVMISDTYPLSLSQLPEIKKNIPTLLISRNNTNDVNRWAINGREARQNEVSKPLGKAAVWPGGNRACPLHVRDHHSPVFCDKTDGGAADRRGAAAVRPCGDFCTDAGVWKAAVAVYR